jgi:hypothetical protein
MGDRQMDERIDMGLGRSATAIASFCPTAQFRIQFSFQEIPNEVLFLF